jgi:2-polyprenyl-6-methoxyphenol hydroxylase-like FAD-dependent oxidoreductase
VVIVGGGPAGSAASMFLKMQGIDSVIIERATFPRYHVGESMTVECGASIRALALEEEMGCRGFPVRSGRDLRRRRLQVGSACCRPRQGLEHISAVHVAGAPRRV